MLVLTHEEQLGGAATDFRPDVVVVPGVLLEPHGDAMRPMRGYDGRGALLGHLRMLGAAARYLHELDWLEANAGDNPRPTPYMITGGVTHDIGPDGIELQSETEVCTEAMLADIDRITRRIPRYRWLVRQYGLPEIIPEDSSTTTFNGSASALYKAEELGYKRVEFSSNFYHGARLALMSRIVRAESGLGHMTVNITDAEAHAERLWDHQRGVQRALYNSLPGRHRLQHEVAGVLGLLVGKYGDEAARELITEKVTGPQLQTRLQSLLAARSPVLGDAPVARLKPVPAPERGSVCRQNWQLLSYLAVRQYVQNCGVPPANRQAA